MTGPQLFLEKMFPCAVLRAEKGNLDQKVFARLKRVLRDQSEPNTELLETCFPMMVSQLRSFALVNGLEMWDDQTVEDFALQSAKCLRDAVC